MKIAAIVAHPDDAETYCGGTLIKYRRLGHEVTIIHATTGDKGYHDMEPSLRKTIRVKEAINAGLLTDITVRCLGLPDGEVTDTLENRTLVQDAIRLAAPDVIFTHNQIDYHPDHVALSRLVIDASFTATVPLCVSQEKYVDKIPQIFFIDTYTGIGFEPEEYVDITDTFEEKCAMLSCHKTQVEWLMHHDNLDLINYINICAQYRGFACGAKYAEGFVRYRAALRANAGNYLPTL